MKETILRKKLFGKEVEITIWDIEEHLAKEILEEAYNEGLRLQNIFNFYDEKSALSKLNRKRKLKAPKELLEVLKRALIICKKTKGYDISLGKNFIERKKGQDMTLLKCSYKDIKIKNDVVELLHPDALIDLGSIAKGYIVDKIADFLKSKGVISGLIDGRGDILVFGKHEFIIEIQHPREKEKSIVSIKIKNKGIATSGDYNQYNNNFDNCHIINKKDYISVTAIAPTLMEADLYATAIFVTPKKDIRRILKNKVNAICIDKNLKIKRYFT